MQPRRLSGATRRQRIEAAIDRLIDVLDRADGDLDLEEDNEDRCEALDDAPVAGGSLIFGDGGNYGPGDPDDAEDDDPLEDEHDREGVV